MTAVWISAIVAVVFAAGLMVLLCVELRKDDDGR